MFDASVRRYERYMTVPFVAGGRTTAGWDCWGLVMAIVRAETGVAIADYPVLPTESAALARAFRDGIDDGERWIVVPPSEARRYDVAVMSGTVTVDGRPRRLPCHAGLYLGASPVIHAEEGIGTALLTAADLGRRLVGVRRWRGLA